MATTVSLNRDSYLIDDGNDAKVIVTDLGDIPGGRALDVSEWDEDVIRAAHIIKRTKSTDTYAPLGVSGDSYKELSEGEEYAGVLKSSVLKTNAQAAIMTVGQVNAAASPYPVTKSIVEGLPQIKFLYADITE